MTSGRHENSLPALGTAKPSIFLLSICLFLLSATVHLCADSVDWPTLGFSQVTTNVFNHPSVIAHAGDNSGRLFVAEQPGRIWIIQNSNVLAQPFLNISNRVLSSGSEQGLLGMAFPAGFSTNNYFYVDYTRQTDGAVVISRFSLTITNSNVADTNTEQIIKVISKPFNNHNGGQIAFGPDGYLYIGVGDGGSEGDPQNNGQKTNTLLGKILRIDVESGISPYSVPTNNPFVGNAGYLPEIWAYGLRNPWRFSFDRTTGDLYIGDVGQNRFEEIDFHPAGSAGGQNYGWRIMEGTNKYNVPSGFTNFSSLSTPVAWYDHFIMPTDGSASVTAGFVYRGPSTPRMDGVYFYGDFITGWIFGIKQVGTNWQSIAILSNSVPIPSTHFWISTFGEGDLGQLYMADYYAGKIYQIQDSLQVWTPTFSQAGGTISSNTVAVSCVTTGAVIHFTTNAKDPTESDPIVASGGTIPVTTGTTNKLRAFRLDLAASSVSKAIFTNKVATPTFFPTTSAVTNGTLVTISTVTPGATLYYTTNGTTPTTGSLIYSSPLPIRQPVTVKTFGIESGYSNSAVATASYSMAQVATPVFSPPVGPIIDGTSITITCSTPGSTIYFTTDGSTPTTNSTVYSFPATINGGTTVKALASAFNYANSSLTSVTFLLRVAESTVVTTFARNLSSPQSVCIDANGNLYVVSAGTGLKKISLAGQVTNLANMTGKGICIDSLGNLYVSNSGNQIWKLDPSGTNLLYATLGGVANILGQLEVDLAGNVYVGYFGSVQKILPDGTVSTLAGPVCSGCAGWAIYVGVGIDAATNIYAATQNDIWQIEQDGTTTLYAGGNGGYFDGPALNSGFQNPQDAAVDGFNNVFVTDFTAVRKISPSGYVSTMAGTGISGYKDGRGSVAQFSGAAGLCVDTNGNIFVVDSGNNCIREISPDTYGIGIPDWWQLAHFGHIGIDPNAHPDHDGMSNYAEFWAGTDPNKSNSVLAIDVSTLINNGQIQIRWPTVAGKTYAVQYSNDLVIWTNLGSLVQGDGSVATLPDATNLQQNLQRFYRVAVVGF